jgi:hypothetical protein
MAFLANFQQVPSFQTYAGTPSFSYFDYMSWNHRFLLPRRNVVAQEEKKIHFGVNVSRQRGSVVAPWMGRPIPQWNSPWPIQ